MTVIPTTDILVIATVFVVLAVVGFYTLTKLRRHRDNLKRELDNSPAIAGDRAHNLIQLASSEASILEREGADTARARGLIRESEGRASVKDYTGAANIARSAHEMLVGIRTSGARPVDRPAPSAAPPRAMPAGSSMAPAASPSFRPPSLSVASPGPASASAVEGDEEPVDPRPTLPKNRVESRFQLNLLSEEIEQRRVRNAKDPRLKAGQEELDGAEIAYRKGDFTEALRLGLRGRRALGSHLDSFPLPPGKGTAAPVRPSNGAGAGAATRAGPTLQATCPTCHRATRASDRFCRSCGTTLKAASCQRCGQEIVESDQYCGKCGAPVGS
jgi:hypothetical protein